jgi:hypothetical protein
MTVPINFRPEAVEEIDATFQWYEEQRGGLGEEFFSAFLSQLDRIRENPEGWAVLYRKIRACPMRRFPYVIYYSCTTRRDQCYCRSTRAQESARLAAKSIAVGERRAPGADYETHGWVWLFLRKPELKTTAEAR